MSTSTMSTSQQIDQGVMYSSSPDDKLSENIWFVWFKTSYDGDVTMETNKQTTISENRASQQIDQGLLTFAITYQNFVTKKGEKNNATKIHF